MAITRTFKVYGIEGQEQEYSFNSSFRDDFTKGDNIKIIECENFDKTGTHDYSIVKITRNTSEECLEELDGQISDGIFENCRTGKVEEIL